MYYSRAADKIRLDFNVKIRLWRILIREYQLKMELSTDQVPFQVGASGGRSPSPAVGPGHLELRGAIAGALTWSPNAGLGVRIDEAFSSTTACAKIAGACSSPGLRSIVIPEW